MNKIKTFLFFHLAILFLKIVDITCSKKNDVLYANPKFSQSTGNGGVKSTEKIVPSLFSEKVETPQPTINFFLEENRNASLRLKLTNEDNRKIRKKFADFQELRQNDILRFHELMAIQNEQIHMIKNLLLAMDQL
ncbi:conserved Plasmodium protein, unknown function [Plasmodium berghei]|uniref:Fam-c protein n=2 Tax=Plasmodium berghei TaxID=5821 RepID=A0A509APZ6_PLABA|nr:conserved Plasmodium protein, unknown function [Plasmodium berghei ANKA]CXI94468.1 conserved Plasmodium protein, unknown function [Plasmodium berghei]SCL97000.1 conserved Plasmodium protein, unknown function [Plasmodium berghei]SCM16529.1 conserved Plasmodium protein, unknown function [Plasmodium berghei]SCM18323.1 conserved Plasmodium protein, unknown function [Plasmodium berghei]SCN27753.1 conserved Plasmodium protein, unknown function [Plasmodium berghei]|eukprot:XP_034423406.1 conserved Plasmodium protein, unknown function [Plasmodium berghei ANKA]